MSEIFAEQFTAVANAVLAGFAIVTEVLAGLAFPKQSSEVSDQAEMLELQRRQLAEQEKTSVEQARVLKLQAEELQASLSERKREAEERRRSQAVRVFIWQARGPILSAPPATLARGASGGRSIVAQVVNASEQPIYGVSIGWFYGDHPESPIYLDKPIMPGAEYSATITVTSKSDPERYEATAHFRDAAQVNWRIWRDGRIEEQQTNDAHSG